MAKVTMMPPAGPDDPIYSEEWSIQSHRKLHRSAGTARKSKAKRTQTGATSGESPSPTQPKPERAGPDKAP